MSIKRHQRASKPERLEDVKITPQAWELFKKAVHHGLRAKKTLGVKRASAGPIRLKRVLKSRKRPS